ncbi:probable 2-carboxy-D-arabinitol-1-phosphatase isoform X2 [Physcomitrium patens]|uniref:2-carboxy-D-arabinitol-1-phosphatase n=1 Tax=Physcomitrium patens TaxID=3218 RepID=A0A7I4D1P2_PHYPA|nr:probable 2-carboxy-D-arabinitol-1-phosphatase isoform X3 [Physcomitrium patens]|eukprot:XP_024365702.1 probable 2-carboxy-D-arabinitol-1-phosphatase isoform X3 [Physcomitrella patens]
MATLLCTALPVSSSYRSKFGVASQLGLSSRHQRLSIPASFSLGSSPGWLSTGFVLRHSALILKVDQRKLRTLVTAALTDAEQTSESSSLKRDLETSVASHDALPPIETRKRVVLVRHGESTWNAIGRIQGSSDFAVLTPKGEGQAETSRQMLLGDNFDSCFYSPLARTKRTAEIIWGDRKKPMKSLFDLREIDLYSFQGLYKQEGKDRYGENYRMWQKDAANFEIDGHYPVRELWARAQSCWQSILNSSGTSILVVAHNAVNQALVATATGLGPEYFRQLLQSNCGVSVLDFTPRMSGDGPPYVCLDRLNQTPSPPLIASGGRKALTRILLVCHGATDSSTQQRFPADEDENVNVLGGIQSGKVAELLLDVNVNVVLHGPQPCVKHTATYITQGKSKETVLERERWQDYLQHEDVPGAESLSSLWERAGQAWQEVVAELGNVPAADSKESQERTVVVVSHPTVHVAMVAHCLGLTQAALGSYHLDTGSLSVIDFPDGSSGKGIVRCLNYTAHLGRWAVPVTRPTLADEDF